MGVGEINRPAGDPAGLPRVGLRAKHQWGRVCPGNDRLVVQREGISREQVWGIKGVGKGRVGERNEALGAGDIKMYPTKRQRAVPLKK